jgi:serine/threonine protein phosphatase PrpC
VNTPLWWTSTVSVPQSNRVCQDVGFAGGQLIVVADGVSGAPAGETASRLAVQAVVQNWVTPDLVPAIATGLLDAHVQTHPEDAGLATTLIWAVIFQDHSNRLFVSVNHIGDSAAFLIGADGRAQKITSDHREPDGGLSRWVGARSVHKVDTSTNEVFPGNVIVLVTDGVELGPRGIASAANGHQYVEQVDRWKAWRVADSIARARFPHSDDATAAIGIVNGPDLNQEK